MMATGVASPSAQGQLMTSTLMPRASAKVKVWPSSSQIKKGGRCNADDGGHKDAGDLVSSLGQRGLGGGGVPHKADDLRQGGVLANTLGPAGQCAVLVDGGGADRGAGELVHRHTLAGEGRLIDRRKPLGDGAVHRDALAGAD